MTTASLAQLDFAPVPVFSFQWLLAAFLFIVGLTIVSEIVVICRARLQARIGSLKPVFRELLESAKKLLKRDDFKPLSSREVKSMSYRLEEVCARNSNLEAELAEERAKSDACLDALARVAEKQAETEAALASLTLQFKTGLQRLDH